MGLVWSGHRQSPWVSVVQFTNDTTGPDQRQSLAGQVADSDGRGPDPTRQSADMSETGADPTGLRQRLVGSA